MLHERAHTCMHACNTQRERHTETHTHNSGIASLDFHPAGGVIATGSADGSLRLWDHGEVLT